MSVDDLLALCVDADLLPVLGEYVAGFVGVGMLLSACVWAIGYVVWFVVAFVQRGG